MAAIAPGGRKTVLSSASVRSDGIDGRRGAVIVDVGDPTSAPYSLGKDMLASLIGVICGQVPMTRNN